MNAKIDELLERVLPERRGEIRERINADIAEIGEFVAVTSFDWDGDGDGKYVNRPAVFPSGANIVDLIYICEGGQIVGDETGNDYVVLDVDGDERAITHSAIDAAAFVRRVLMFVQS